MYVVEGSKVFQLKKNVFYLGRPNNCLSIAEVSTQSFNAECSSNTIDEKLFVENIEL